MEVVVYENVWKRFGDVEALRGMTHSVPKGEVHVLLGPNGSGKSTLMRITAGTLVPDRGRVLVLGSEPYKTDGGKSRIGYAPQEDLLYERLTGLENYLFYAGLEGVPKSEALKRYRELRELLELGEWFEKRKVATYSGGMRKRASIAVALVSDPDVLILDEPTSGLDPEGRRKLWDVLLSLRGREKTMIIATHLFEDAEVLADKVVVMRSGELKAVGTVDELKAKAGYAYSVEVEFAASPGKEVEKLLEKASRSVLRIGYTYKIYTNDPGVVETLRSELSRAGAKFLRLELKHVSLADVYFLVTGVTLE